MTAMNKRFDEDRYISGNSQRIENNMRKFFQSSIEYIKEDISSERASLCFVDNPESYIKEIKLTDFNEPIRTVFNCVDDICLCQDVIAVYCVVLRGSVGHEDGIYYYSPRARTVFLYGDLNDELAVKLSGLRDFQAFIYAFADLKNTVLLHNAGGLFESCIEIGRVFERISIKTQGIVRKIALYTFNPNIHAHALKLNLNNLLLIKAMAIRC